MPFIKWCYQQHGSPKNPAIILLHGFMGSAESWKSVTSHLKDSYYCLSLDLPGHGNTVVTEEASYTMPETAGEIIRLMNDMNIAQSHLIGYSMGGRLALYLAVRFPDRFKKVILESASPGLKSPQDRKLRRIRDEELATFLEKQGMDLFLKFWYNQPIFSALKTNPDFPNIIEQRKNNDPNRLAASLRRMGTGVQPSLWKDLERVSVPILLLVGEKDQKFRNISSQMSALSKNIRTEIIENSGHTIHIENEKKYVTEIKKFLGK